MLAQPLLRKQKTQLKWKKRRECNAEKKNEPATPAVLAPTTERATQTNEKLAKKKIVSIDAGRKYFYTRTAQGNHR